MTILSLTTVKLSQWTIVEHCEMLKKEFPSPPENSSLKLSIKLQVFWNMTSLQEDIGSNFLKMKKEVEECLFVGDFSENYTPVWQDAVQRVPWSDLQVTTHTFIPYHKKNDKIDFVSFVVVSETTYHMYERVNAFQREIIAYI